MACMYAASKSCATMWGVACLLLCLATTAVALHTGWPACERRALQSSGYIDIPGSGETLKHYFYWLFGPRSWPSDGRDPPVVMWMTGGPGCSSGIALLLENGPCNMDESAGRLYRNAYGWNDEAYLLFVDQPTGVGYSYGDSFNYVHNESEMAEDMYNFLQAFARRFARPNISGTSDFFVIGESYGGHYVPSVGYRILQGNRHHDGLPINLRAISIGNGLTDPYTQYPAYAELAYNWCNEKLGHPCIPKEAYDSMLSLLPACLEAIAACNTGATDQNDACLSVGFICEEYAAPYSETGLNNYDIRKPCIGDLCYPMNHTLDFFHSEDVIAALGADQSAAWSTCNRDVGALFVRDFYRNFNFTIPPLLQAGIRVLVYAGDVDYICNWIGNKAWVLALNWDGKAGFNAAADVEFSVDGRAAGRERSFANFSFVQIYDAGHMVPMDQPAVALYMLRRFLHAQSMSG